MKMDRPPKVEALEKDVVELEAERTSDPRGGVTIERAVKGSPSAREDADIIKADVLRQEIGDKMPAGAKTESAPIDFSAIASNIDSMSKAELDSRAKWKKFFDSDEAERFQNLRKGLSKIRGAEQFAENYQRALDKKGEEQAMRYLEIIGSGKLARVDENGEFVSNSVGTRDGGGLMGHI